MSEENPMKQILVEKVTVNIGVGSPGDRLENAKELLKRLTGNCVPIETTVRRREPVFKLRKGLAIGCKVTMRGENAVKFLEKALAARRRTLKATNFDKRGNFAFGIHEYIDFPGAKYDPTLGMFGFDICVSLYRKGRRVIKRRIAPGKIGNSHLIKQEEAIGFARSALNVKIEE